MKPDMLLMDEPSTALDPRNRRTLIRVLRARPETKLIASHDLDLVLETCRRVLLIADGALAADGPRRNFCATRRFWKQTDWSCRCASRVCRNCESCIAGLHTV